MTFFSKKILVQVGEGIDDPQDQAAFESVLSTYTFSSNKPDGVAFEGPFLRALEDAGLSDLRDTFVGRYHDALLSD